jgi:rhodanese-related sulfurtransferase
MNEQIKHHSDKLAYETDSWDLKVALEAEEHIVVIDARSPQAFEQEHIPGAINIPHRNMSSESVEHLDKKALIVTYCDGIGCNASTKGALNMAQLGFRVKELIGGEANLEIRRICSTMDWQEWRTVPFLDPYGMQVEWQTLEAIAQTRAIDLWLLVPLGIAINRMLPNSGEVPLPWQRRLDVFFGDQGMA